MIKKWFSKNEAAIVDREGKSDIWKLFGAVEREEKVINNHFLQGMQEGLCF